MNEAQTRFNKIDPKLRDAGWGIVPGSKILVEQSAYIAPGRITTTGLRRIETSNIKTSI
jgi:type I restriction enzyme R subunit